MTDRVGNDVATIVEERAAVLGFARTFSAGVARHLAAGRLSADMATELQQTVQRFAGDVAIGLHRDGLDPVEVRRAMRDIVVAGRAA